MLPGSWLSGSNGADRAPELWSAPDQPSVYAWLDGLRGVAALVVYFYHFTLTWYPIIRTGYGASDHDCFFIQWPFVRVLFSGRAAVATFFIISGFVLSLRVLRLGRSGRHQDALEALAQSCFRRPFRLYLPIIAATFLIACASWYGVFVQHPLNVNLPPRSDSLSTQLYHWLYTTIFLIDPFRVIDGRNNMYSPPNNGHLWTIPTEMKGSLLIFALLLMLVRTRLLIRHAVLIVLAYWVMHDGDFDMALFIIGLLLAEVSLLLESAAPADHSLLPTGIAPASPRQRLMRRGLAMLRVSLCIAGFLSGWFLMCYPDYGDVESRTYRGLATSAVIPHRYSTVVERRQNYWQSVGSVLFVTSLVCLPSGSLLAPFRSWFNFIPFRRPHPDVQTANRQPLLQALFTTPFALLLGRLSYALYLFHGPVNQSVMFRRFLPALNHYKELVAQADKAFEVAVADRIMAVARNDYLAKFAIAALINTAVLFLISHLFWLLVDRHASSVGKWVAKRCWLRK